MVKQCEKNRMMQERGKRIVGVWIQATFLSSIFFFPPKVVTTVGIAQQKNITYAAVAGPKCPYDAFDCGSIGYISYPFWGGSRGVECGRQGFQLICKAGVPLLKISSLSYAVQKLDFNTTTLTVSRQDLLSATCPKRLYNTTLDFSLFTYPPKSPDVNLTLYYDCNPHYQLSDYNTFTCKDGNDEIRNVFTTGNASSGPGDGITCNSNIYVPVKKEDAQSLQNPTSSSINIWRSALVSGFSIQWSPDEKQHQYPYYNQKAYSNRKCDYQNMCSSTGSAGGHVSSAAPQQHQVQSPPTSSSAEGMPPVQNPSNSHQAGKGMPPVQSPGYPPESLRYYHPLANGSSAGKSPKRVAIGVALSAVGVIILCICISCFLKRKHSSINNDQNPECKQDVKKLLLQHGSLAPKRYKYSEIKKMTKSFSDKLGQGGFGSVYKGTLPNGRLVAVKVLIETTDGNGEEFVNEVATISRTSHVNIVSLLGFCHDRNKRAIVYEFMPNMSLDKFLASTADAHCCLDLEKLYRIAVGIAKGLEYLHTGCTTRIVHFDIKPQNILLDDDLCPKISDFGLAKLCKKKQSVLSVLGTRGTIGYIAPEVFSRNFGGVSHKSDVYSYGMMLLEMAAARRVAEAEAEAEVEENQLSENYFPDKLYQQEIIEVTRILDDWMSEEEEERRRKMFVVGFWCIQTIPSDRPSISKVVEMLEGCLQSIQIPPKPFLFAPNLPSHEISSTISANVEIEYSALD